MDAQLQRELLTGSILLSVLLVCGLVAHLARTMLKLRQEFVQYFFAIDVTLLTLAVITSNRTITGMESILIAGSSTPQHSVLASQLLTVLVLVIACERLLRFLLGREMQYMRTLPMLGGLLLFFLLINVVTPLLGLYAEFQHNFLYGPIVALALYATAQRDGFEPLLRVVRNSYFIYLGAALLCLVLRPAMVADFTYQGGIIPGLSIRFYGFGTHPNALAPYCLMLLCCLWVVPFEKRTMNRLGWAVGCLAMVLTQSKTTLALGVAMFAVMWFQSQRDALRAGQPSRYRAFSNRITLSSVGAVSLVAVAALAALLAGAIDVEAIEAALGSETLLTLTGRTYIWQISLTDLWENPLFGYGADLWGPAYQQHMNLFVAHAHNQYVHTLGDSGFVGLAALIVYLGVLCLYSWRVRRETRWLSVALASYIFLRGITEAPLVVDSMFGSDFAAHMILLTLCAGGMRDGVRGSGYPVRAAAVGRSAAGTPAGVGANV